MTFVDGSQSYTYAEFRKKSIELAHLFSRYGLNAGDRIAILSQNMPNWTVSLFSIVAFGRVAVPILPDSSESEVTNILNHSECKAIFVSQRMAGKLSDEVKKKLTLIIDMDTLEIIQRDDAEFTCDGWGKEPSPDDLAMIIYTSGTSGRAKGVMLSHRNFCQNVIEAWHAQKANKRDRWLSILPMSHTYEMSFSVLYPLFVGGCVYHIKKLPTPTILIETMKKVRPTIMCSVPLIIEKVYKASIVPTIERSRVLSWMRKKTPKLLYFLIGKRLYKTFGGKLKFFGIGVFRASGAMDMVIQGISWSVEQCGLNADFVGALPTAIMKPLSGSGARGMMLEAMKNYGPDSFVGRLSCIFQGSTDTTFYILAVYFGSVSIRNTRHAVACGLLADLAGVIAAIAIAYLFFG